MIRYNNDYNHGAHPAILQALAETNDTAYGGYGEDEWALNVLRRELGVDSGSVLQGLSRIERDSALRLLKKEDISIRQIERLTGINRGVIQKA